LKPPILDEKGGGINPAPRTGSSVGADGGIVFAGFTSHRKVLESAENAWISTWLEMHQSIFTANRSATSGHLWLSGLLLSQPHLRIVDAKLGY